MGQVRGWSAGLGTNRHPAKELTRTVCRAPVLDAMDGYDLGGVVDAVDDAVVASAGGVHPCKLSYERLAKPMGVLTYRAVKGRQGSIADLGRKPVEVAESFGGDPDLVHRARGSG